MRPPATCVIMCWRQAIVMCYALAYTQACVSSQTGGSGLKHAECSLALVCRMVHPFTMAFFSASATVADMLVA